MFESVRAGVPVFALTWAFVKPQNARHNVTFNSSTPANNEKRISSSGSYPKSGRQAANNKKLIASLHIADACRAEVASKCSKYPKRQRWQ